MKIRQTDLGNQTSTSKVDRANRKISPIKQHLRELRAFMENVSSEQLTPDTMLVACLKASIVKAYDFAIFSHSNLKPEFAFHCVGGLRSICEDIIILKFVSNLEDEEQSRLLMTDLLNSFEKSTVYQTPFFESFRSGQPIVQSMKGAGIKLDNSKEVNQIWKKNGWPNMRRSNWPSTEQIARKISPGTVEVVYNYIFRLTSSAVHFNVQSLFRTGWGEITGPGTGSFKYSTKNMNRYYAALCQIYGTFLLTIYFEFFPEILGVTPKVEQRLQRLRVALAHQERWPEMVTFEEANLPIPAGNPIYRIVSQHLLAEEFKDGFIRGADRKMLLSETK